MNFVVTRIYQCRACSADRPDFNLYIMCTQYLQERERERRGDIMSHMGNVSVRDGSITRGVSNCSLFIYSYQTYIRSYVQREMLKWEGRGGGWVFDVCKSILFCHSLDHTAHEPQSASKFLLNIPILVLYYRVKKDSFTVCVQTTKTQGTTRSENHVQGGRRDYIICFSFSPTKSQFNGFL